MGLQCGIAEVNGTALYYQEDGGGHPVVLVHGHTVDSRMWDDQVQRLGTKYRVIRYDSRGYGRSAIPSNKKYAHTDDLKALLDHLEVSRAHVIGLSMGGLIALDFALAWPETVSSLVTVDAVLGGYDWNEAGNLIRSVHRTALKHGVEKAKNVWLESALFAPAMEKTKVAASIRRMVTDYTGWHWLNRAPIRGNEPVAIDRLHEISCPTLVVVGQRDTPDFQAIAEILHMGIHNARKTILAGAGHMANMEEPEKFNEILMEFLDWAELE
ncbi:MAG: alpha/beta fold hydrolase [SAR202 cluster bacterium]|nr:alpha/beta fold hydrolase [SAR202 cluster bacterium]